MKQDRAAVFFFAVVGVALFFWVWRYGPTWPWDDSYGFLRYRDWLISGERNAWDIVKARSNEHLIAFHLSVALATLELSGFYMKALIYENAVLLLAGGMLVWLSLRQTLTAATFPILFAFVIAISILNPSQMAYLLWEFQIWWYLDLAMFAATIFLVERFGFRFYPAVLLFCLLGTGSEAQGAFLWLSTGVHLFLLMARAADRSARIRGLVALVSHMFLFLLAAWLLMHGESNEVGHIKASQSLLSHLSYFVKLVGGGFGNQDESVALAFGSVSLMLWVAFTANAARRMFDTTESRVALLLTGMPLLWTIAFAIGRESFGAAWALGDFHQAPMLMTFFMGIAVYALELASKIPKARLSAFAVVLFSVLPIATGAKWGYERSVYVRVKSNLAAAANCSGAPIDRKNMLRLIGLDNFGYVYDSTLHYVGQLCSHQPDVQGWVADMQANLQQ